MESKAVYKLRLKAELSEVGNEIEKLIVRTDQVAENIKQGYDVLEDGLLAKQSSTQANLSKSSISRDEAWDLVWDNVWDEVKKFNRQATPEIKQDYNKLEPALQAKQSALQLQFHESLMSANEVWHEVWNEVWYEVKGIVEEMNRQATTELMQVGEELEALLVKQSALQAKLHELLMSDDEAWNVLKDVTHAMVERTSSNTES